MIRQTYHMYGYFYPRSPHGERLTDNSVATIHIQISIHALRMESDIVSNVFGGQPVISIHALRMESDTRNHYGYR